LLGIRRPFGHTGDGDCQRIVEYPRLVQDLMGSAPHGHTFSGPAGLCVLHG
jgi:hypothetical protein